MSEHNDGKIHYNACKRSCRRNFELVSHTESAQHRSNVIDLDGKRSVTAFVSTSILHIPE